MLTFILMSVEQKRIKEIIQKIKEIDKDEEEKIRQKINKVHEVYGEYDILVKIKSINEKDANQIIQKIKSIQGINYIRTYIVIHKTHNTDKPSKEGFIYHQ